LDSPLTPVKCVSVRRDPTVARIGLAVCIDDDPGQGGSRRDADNGAMHVARITVVDCTAGDDKRRHDDRSLVGCGP
jgi:hypothetical protein